MMSKKYLHRMIAALTASALLLAGCTSGDQASSDDGRSGEGFTLKVGSTGQSFPNGYREDGKLVGFDVEVTEEIANKLGWEVEWITSDFSGLLGQLESGKIDTVANAVAMNDERKAKYDFSETYAYYASQLAVAKDSNFQTAEDLHGKTVSGVLGSNQVKNLETWDTDKNFNIRTYENREGAVNDLKLGRVDAYVQSRPVLLAEIESGESDLRLVGEGFLPVPVGFPFRKDEDPEVLDKVNDALTELREDGTLAELSNKYFGADITTEVQGNEP